MLKQNKYITPRTIQLSLGFLWLLDGALQLQPKMFTKAFAYRVILPAAQGQPFFVSDPMHWSINLLLTHPALFNTLFALIQFLLGVLIIHKRTVRIGLSASVVWALFVWVIGEGYSGIFSGQASLLMGAPGAALLYALLALAVLPRKKEIHTQQNIAYWVVLVWAFVWIAGGAFQVLPKQGATANIGVMITANADSASGWLGSMDKQLGSWLKSVGSQNAQVPYQKTTNMPMIEEKTKQSSTPQNDYILILAFWLIATGIGLGVLKKGLIRKISVFLGLVLSLLFWFVGQNMGINFNGTATDPNSGPLFILLGLAILGTPDIDSKLSDLGHKVSRALIGNYHSDGENEAPQS